jgi:hypothetical protein
MRDECINSLLETCFAIDSSLDWAVGVACFQGANRILSGPFSAGVIVADSEIDSSIAFLDQDPLEALLVGHRVDQSPMEAQPCCCCSLLISKIQTSVGRTRNGVLSKVRT